MKTWNKNPDDPATCEHEFYRPRFGIPFCPKCNITKIVFEKGQVEGLEYRFVDIEEAIKKGYPGFENEVLGKTYWDIYRSGLFLFDSDKPIRFIATDQGEPEDATFSRDWSWVCGELNRALKGKVTE